MTVTIELETVTLRKILSHLKRFVHMDSQVEPMKHFRLTVDSQTDTLNIRSSNDITHCSYNIPIVSYGRNKEDAIIIAPVTLESFARKFSSPQVKLSINSDKNKIEIKGGTTKSSMTCISGVFPSMSTEIAIAQLTMSASDLLSISQKVIDTYSEDSGKAFVQAIYIEVASNTVTTATLDGFSMSALFNFPMAHADKDFTMLLHASEFKKLLPIFSDLDTDEVIVKYHPDLVIIESGDFSCSMKSVDARYPDFRKQIPSQAEALVTINTKDFNSAVTATDSVDGMCQLDVYEDESGTYVLKVSASNTEQSYETLVDLQTHQGTEIGCVFSAKLLRKLLNRANGLGYDTVDCMFTQVGTTYILTFHPSTDKAFISLLMPVAEQTDRQKLSLDGN